MTALTPAQRGALVRRTEKTVIAAAKRCEAALSREIDCLEEGWLSAADVHRHRAELASIQAFAAVAHMQKKLNGEQT